MNGQHIPGTPMVVDYWKTKNLPPRLLFFLTHMHAGMCSEWLLRREGVCRPIFSSLVAL